MKLTVQKLLEMEEFSDFRVISGEKGLDKEVTTVSVIDAPDIYNWLRGGEILLTSGYVLERNMACMTELLIKIHSEGAVALFVKFGRFFDQFSKEIIELSNKLQFPIVFMPLNYAFTDVINPVLSKIVNLQNEVIRTSEKMNRKFTGIAVRQEGIEQVLKSLSEIINYETVFIHSYTNKIYKSNDQLEDTYIIQNYLHEYPCFPINVNKKMYGYVVVMDQTYKASEYDLIAIEHASTIIKLEIQKKISNMEVEKKYRDNLVMDLLFNNIKSLDEALERGKIFHWTFDKPYQVVIFEIDDFKEHYLRKNSDARGMERKSREILDYIVNEIKHTFINSIYTTFTEKVIFIMEEEGKSNLLIKSLLETVANLIFDKFNYTLSISLGKKKTNILDAGESYEEAKKTVNLSRKLLGNRKIVFYEDLGFYQLLTEIKDIKAVQMFRRPQIEKLINYDTEYNTNLFETLQVIINHSWNLHHTSEAMYVHYNTLKNRFKRIQEVIDIDLESSDIKLELEFAVKIWQLI